MYPAEPSADTAIEQARETWLRGYRDTIAAGREVPVVDVPAELGDTARTSVEATESLARLGRRSSFVVSIDLRALESARQARERAQQPARQSAAGQRPSQRRRKRRNKR